MQQWFVHFHTNSTHAIFAPKKATPVRRHAQGLLLTSRSHREQCPDFSCDQTRTLFQQFLHIFPGVRDTPDFPYML